MQSSTVLFLAAIFVVSTLALDFGELFIDSLISEEEYAASNPEITRFARQAPTNPPPGCPTHNDFGPHHKGKSCCKSEKSLEIIFKDKEIFQDCFNEVINKINRTEDYLTLDFLSCSKVNVMKMKFACVHECIGKKLKLLTDDGKADNANVRKIVKEKVFTEEWMKQIADRSIDTCLRTLNDTIWSTPETGALKCNPSGLLLKHCLWIQTEMNCPEANRKTDQHCRRLQATLEKMKTDSTM
uniref:Odorant binding protein 8 n=1 Tax=Subpsaltria yangi TaxID=1195109 RepID=A0A385IUP4_9HEMI|nr:odorant binding protein 8 [Subpsaltria yangi]